MKLTLLTAVTGAIVLSMQVALAQCTFTKITTGEIVNRKFGSRPQFGDRSPLTTYKSRFPSLS